MGEESGKGDGGYIPFCPSPAQIRSKTAQIRQKSGVFWIKIPNHAIFPFSRLTCPEPFLYHVQVARIGPTEASDGLIFQLAHGLKERFIFVDPFPEVPFEPCDCLATASLCLDAVGIAEPSVLADWHEDRCAGPTGASAIDIILFYLLQVYNLHRTPLNSE